MPYRRACYAIFVVSAWLMLAPAVGLAESPSPMKGETVYRRLGCPACHSIGGVGNRRYPLDGVGSRLTADVIRKWIIAPTEMKPGVRKPSYDKTPKDDLDAVVGYLSRLATTE